MTMQYKDQTTLIRCLFGIDLPKFLVDYLINPSSHVFPGASEDPASSSEGISVWRSNSLLRSARPDITNHYFVLCFLGSKAVCIDITNGNEHDAPIVIINMSGSDPPQTVNTSYKQFLSRIYKGADCFETLGFAPKETAQLWFTKGLERLDWHMKNLSFRYSHSDGGQIPRSHVWRPYRFCVQDVILGITVIRHDRKFNRLEVDVFLTASIPEYQADSGCRALTLILLSDAYKSGGSMEIRFSKHVEGGKVPHELVSLAATLKVELNHINDGGITAQEAKQLYLALSGFSEKLQVKILELDRTAKLSSATICYAMHHGVWSGPELESIVLSSRFPGSILRGELAEESCHLFQYHMFTGRTALMGGYLDRRLSGREHSLSTGEQENESDAIVEMEDDERCLMISFDPEFCAKHYVLNEDVPVDIPWLAVPMDDLCLKSGRSLLVLIRARDPQEMADCLQGDVDQAITLRKKYVDSDICIMVPADFLRLDLASTVYKATEAGIGVIVCPEFILQMDLDVRNRLESLRIMRQ